MPNLVVVGAQWGDEGKGKVVDHLAQSANMVVRYQGGPNAGHTVCFRGREVVLHQLPVGVLTPRVKCVIGCGCVVDPYVLQEEFRSLSRLKISARGRLVIDARAHMIMPYHRTLDRLREEQAAGKRIGTTGRGIGPVYRDKVSRVGIRAADLLSEESFANKLGRNVAAANSVLMERYKADPISYRQLVKEYWRNTRGMVSMVRDGSLLIEKSLAGGKRVLFEGAQGVHLDIDLGTYPYVTSSSTGAWGVSSGTGISPVWLQEVVGVAKAYVTRVGMGPFPTEMKDADSELLRKLGAEYGATTGRPRRCGWFDAGLLRASVRYNKFAALVITKLDVFDSLDEMRICTGYRLDGRVVKEFDAAHADSLEPQFITMPGWREPTGDCRKYRELPPAARKYLKKIEDLVGCPIALVSVGPDRRQMVEMRTGALKWLKHGHRMAM